MLEKLRAVNSAELKRLGGRRDFSLQRGSMNHANLDRAKEVEAIHPAVRVHPETNEKCLYVSMSHTSCFEGWTEEESKPLLEYLQTVITRHEYTCRMKWEKGTLGLWDNRCTQHLAINDYGGSRRTMHRLIVRSEKPKASIGKKAFLKGSFRG